VHESAIARVVVWPLFINIYSGSNYHDLTSECPNRRRGATLAASAGRIALRLSPARSIPCRASAVAPRPRPSSLRLSRPDRMLRRDPDQGHSALRIACLAAWCLEFTSSRTPDQSSTPSKQAGLKRRHPGTSYTRSRRSSSALRINSSARPTAVSKTTAGRRTCCGHPGPSSGL